MVGDKRYSTRRKVLSKEGNTSKWPYRCDCGSIPYKSRKGGWVCPEGCRDDNKGGT